MMRTVLVVSAAAAAFPAAAFAENTPTGPATLMSRWTGASTQEGRPPEVLVAAKVEVAAGGQAGTIRIRARDGADSGVGDPVQLPAEPGVYTFPAPHIRWDYRSGSLGFDQLTGEHAVLSRQPCDPARGVAGDPCQITHVDITRDGEPAQVLDGAALAVTGVFEPDLDRDLAGDRTEDRTDLKISATPTRAADGTVRIAVTLTNAGPRSADLPRVTTALAGAHLDGCIKPGPATWFLIGEGCPLDTPLAAGATRTLTITSDTPDAIATTITVSGEGPDLADADNTVRVDLPAAAPYALSAAKVHHLRSGVKVKVRGVRDGRARVKVTFANGVTLAKNVTLKARTERTVTLRATGHKLRALRTAIRKHGLRASVTVSTLNGKSPAKAQTTVRL